MEHLQTIVHRYFPLLLIPLGFLIGGIFLSGGFTVESFWGDIRCRSLDSPILIQMILAALWVLSGHKRRHYFLAWLNLKNVLGWYLMLLGSLGLALWTWDFDSPGRLWDFYHQGKALSHEQWKSLTNFLWFWPWLIHGIWMFLSFCRARRGKEPFSISMEKTLWPLSALALCFVFIPFKLWKPDWDSWFLVFTFLFGAIGFGIGWTWPPSPVSEKKIKKYLWIGTGLFCGVFLVLCFNRYEIFRVYEDFPMFIQALWTTLHGKIMHVTGWVFDGQGKSLFAFHFQPFLFLVLPLYAIFSDPKILLGLHVLGLSLAALPLYGIVKGRIGNPWVALAFVLAYLYSPLIQRGVMHDFHPEDLIPLFLFSTFYFMQKGKMTFYVLSTVLLLSLREDCFIHVVILGAYAILFERKWKFGSLALVLGFAWFLLSFEWIIPSLRGTEDINVFLRRYRYFQAENLPGLILSILTHPSKVLDLLTRPDAIVGRFLLSLPLLFLPWMSLRSIFLIVAFNLKFFLSSESNVRYLESSYVFFILPNYFLAAVLSADVLLKKFRSREMLRDRLSCALCGYLVAATIFFNFFFKPIDHKKYGPLDYDLLVFSPLGMRFDPSFYIGDNPRAKMEKAFIKKYIPEGKSLSTRVRFATHLSNREILRFFPDYADAEYIFLDLFGEPVRYWEKLDPVLITKLLMNSTYGVVAYRDGCLLLKNGHSKEKNAHVMKDFFRRHSSRQFSSKIDRTEPDPQALSGWAWKADRRDVPDFLVFGAYHDLPQGQYRAIFKLKTTWNKVEDPIAELSITARKDGKIRIIHQKEIRGTDFHFGDYYQDFVVDFNTQGLKEIEFRIRYLGEGNIWFSHVDLWAPHIAIDQIYRFMIRS